MNQIINMILRQLTRRLVNKGIDAGLNQAAKLGRKPEPVAGRDAAAQEDAPLSKAEIRSQRQARKAAQQARRAAKLVGRGTRM